MSVMATAVPGPARVLRLEIKRSVVPWVLPLLAALVYFDAIRTASGFPPVWTLRASVITDHMLSEFEVFGAGLAAWVGSREGRRKTSDLVASTSRAAWARHAVALGATACWLLLAFLAGVAALYVQTALQATWGGPPLWPVFAGVADVIVVTVIGFTCGTLFPGRFTAPLVAVAVVVLGYAGLHAALSVTGTSSKYGLLAPGTSPPNVDAGVFYHALQRGTGGLPVRGVHGNPGRGRGVLARRVPAGSPRLVPRGTAACGGRGPDRARAARRSAAGGGGRPDDHGRLAAPAGRSVRRPVASADHRRRLAVRVAARWFAARLAGRAPAGGGVRSGHARADPMSAASDLSHRRLEAAP